MSVFPFNITNPGFDLGGILTSPEAAFVTALYAAGSSASENEVLTWKSGAPSWETLAAGSGDVVGPSSAVDSNFASFNLTTGKIIKDSGSKASDFATASHNHTGVYQPLATVLTNTTASFTTALESKLSGIEPGAEVNNISDINATDLTDGGATTLHAHEGTAILSTGETGGTKFLRENGDGTSSWQTIPAGGGNVSKVGTPVDNQVGVWTGDGTIEGDAGLTFDTATDTLTTVNLALSGTVNGDIIPNTDSTHDIGSDAVRYSNVFADNLNAPILKSSISSLLIVSSAGGYSTQFFAGTENWLQLYGTNTGLPVKILAAGSDTNIGINLTPKGTGAVAISTTLELGHASDTTISRSAAGVIAVEGVVIPSISSTNTLTNKRVTPRTGTTTSSATPTINTDNVDFYSLTAQAVDITSFTTNLSGTPTEGQKLWIAITGTAARAITWGASFENGPVALPTTTVTTTRLDVGFIWNSVTSKWRCVASGSTA